MPWDKAFNDLKNQGWGNSSGWGKELNIPAGSEADKAWRNIQSFTFNYDGKTHTKDAIVVGDLAVICGQEPFLILHIHTLSSFDKAIPAGTWSVEELVEWCKKVQQSQQSSWNNLKLVKEASDWENDLNVIARGQILAWCRGVKVR